MRDTTFIYVLCDPSTGEIRYIGKTDKPKERLQRHIWFSTKKQPLPQFHSACWIRSLVAVGETPILKVIREVPYSERKYWERRAIRVYKAVGFDLTNTTDGGDGAGSGEHNHNFGKKLSPEQKAILLAANLGRVPWNKGRKSPETSGENHHTFGKIISAETRARMSEASKRNKAAPLNGRRGAIKTRGVKRKGSTSAFRGISWNPRYQMWNSQMRIPGVHLYLGRFKREIDAAVAFDQAMERHFGDSGKFNFSYDPACYI